MPWEGRYYWPRGPPGPGRNTLGCQDAFAVIAMDSFHQRLAQGVPVGESLREALREGRRLRLGEVRQKWGEASMKALGIRSG
jgi:hypothetical protein